MQAAVDVLLRDRDHQAQVGHRHFALGLACALLAGRHLLVNLAQVGQRQRHARLQVDHALLQFFNGRQIAAQHRAVRIGAVDFTVAPLQVGLVAREDLDKVGARHAAAVYADVQHGALDRAHFVHLAAQGVAQLFDDLGGETDAQQLVRDHGLRFFVGRRTVAVVLEGVAHQVELLLDQRELLQRALAQLGQLLGRVAGRGAAGAAAVALFFLVLDLFFFLVILFRGSGRVSHRSGWRRGVFQVDEAIHHVVDLQLVAGDLVRQRDDFRNRGRARRDGLHHVLQALLDALGDLDLAFARKQRHRAHFTHVHADRVGGAAEVGVDGRQRGRGGGFDFVFAGRGHGLVRQQHHFGFGGALVDGDAHVVEGRDDAFDRFRIDDVFRQVVVDLGMGQVAALLAHIDQVLQLLAALFEFGFRETGFVQHAEALRLALARLRGGLHFGALDGVQRRDFVVLRHEFARLAAAAARDLHLRQQIARGVDRGQRGGVGGLADGADGGHGGAGHRFDAAHGAGAHDFRRFLGSGLGHRRRNWSSNRRFRLGRLQGGQLAALAHDDRRHGRLGLRLHVFGGQVDAGIDVGSSFVDRRSGGFGHHFFDRGGDRDRSSRRRRSNVGHDWRCDRLVRHRTAGGQDGVGLRLQRGQARTGLDHRHLGRRFRFEEVGGRGFRHCQRRRSLGRRFFRCQCQCLGGVFHT